MEFDEEPLVDFEKGKPSQKYQGAKKIFNIRRWTKQQKIIGILVVALVVSVIANISLFGVTLHYASITQKNETVNSIIKNVRSASILRC